jgi:hypothetical protein
LSRDFNLEKKLETFDEATKWLETNERVQIKDIRLLLILKNLRLYLTNTMKWMIVDSYQYYKTYNCR